MSIWAPLPIPVIAIGGPGRGSLQLNPGELWAWEGAMAGWDSTGEWPPKHMFWLLLESPTQRPLNQITSSSSTLQCPCLAASSGSMCSVVQANVRGAVNAVSRRGMYNAGHAGRVRGTCSVEHICFEPMSRKNAGPWHCSSAYSFQIVSTSPPHSASPHTHFPLD